MILFVPNILVLDYLNSSGQSNPTLKSNALSNMKKGYQRELTYRHKDGSYSAFGESDASGSMWLTAFVVKSFAQAREYIFVDENDLQISVSWITKKQLENGCFPIVGKVFHKEMKGGLGDNGSPTALSAYVLISLLETGLDIDEKIINNGVYCLLGERDPDLYTLALSTYALTLISEKTKTNEARNIAEKNLEQLLNLAQTDKQNEMWWEKPGSKSMSISVEITAYAILILSKLGGESNLLNALNAVRWISKQRNANGGFVSTQDTVVALEALASYAVAAPNKNVNLELEASTDKSWTHTFFLAEEDKMVLQQRTLTDLPATLTIIAQGSGCALIQSNIRYNVRNAPISEAFNLTTSLNSVIENNCRELLFEAQVAYNLPDGTSNMAVVEVDMLSGYSPVKSSLDALKFNTAVNLKRWDEKDGKVNLYFDSLSNELLTLNFLMKQEVEVESPQPAQVQVYDYYEQELIVTKSYGLDNINCEPELLPEPIPVDDSEQEITTVSEVSDATVLDQEIADEPNRKTKPLDPFENFSTVEHDLDFPEGNEGPEPVFVPAPPVNTHVHIRDVAEAAPLVASSCPVCLDEAPSGFSQLYCSSTSVLKLSTRSPRSAKLLNDVSPGRRPSRVNKNISLIMDRSCQCDLLSREGSQVIVMVTSRGSSSLTASEKPSLHLDQGVRVIRITSSRGTPNIINQARKRC